MKKVNFQIEIDGVDVASSLLEYKLIFLRILKNDQVNEVQVLDEVLI